MRRSVTECFFSGGLLPVVLAVLLTACGAPPEGAGPEGAAPEGAAPEATAPEAAAPEATPPAATAGPVDPEDPTILRRPFTAEELRGEWVEGLTVKLRRTTSTGEVLERWTVVAADAEAVDIEYAALDAGEEASEPTVQHNTWEELRDHASFPADRSTVEEVTLETALGTLDGWLYTVRDEAAGTVTELFFARDLPGAPVRMRMLKDGAPLMELEQIERSKSLRATEP